MSDLRQPARRPFGEELRELMKERGMTFRELEAELRRTDREGRGLTNSHLVNLAQQRNPPSARAMNLVAEIFELRSGHFLEARIHAVVDRLDLRHREHEAVLAELDLIDEARRDQQHRVRTPLAARADVSPGSRCELCHHNPVETFGVGAEVLLKPHPARDGDVMLMCANCREAAAEGWGPRPKRPREAIPQPRAATFNPMGGPVDLSKIPREEFLNPEDAPNNPSIGARDSPTVADPNKAR